MSFAVPSLPSLSPLPLCNHPARPSRSSPRRSALPAAAAAAANAERERAENGRSLMRALYDDGFGSASVKDYFDATRAIMKDDGGPPPRWFCPVECKPSVEDPPLLLFLPGSDGVGTGLILHHRSLGKVFQVRCLHIPVNDRTPFEGLVKIVEQTIKYEHAVSPKRPIYIVGESFGGCLALAVAARNPTIDLILILVNPATSFQKNKVQPLLPVVEALPSNLHFTVPYLLSFVMGNPLKMAMVSVADDLPPQQTLEQLQYSLPSLLPLLSELSNIIPKNTLLWKLKLLKSAAAYTNSRLHAVEAEVLLLVSDNDNLLPSAEEADRLWASLKNCRVRHFKDNGHTLLLEDGINLLSIIKATRIYRRSRQHDYVTDFLPPTISEFQKSFKRDNRWYDLLVNPIMFSTLKDGTIVRGLSGVPNKGPVLLVGNHMLMGMELNSLYEGFVREKKAVLRGMAHPVLFATKYETSSQEMTRFDEMSIYGALPVTPINMYRLFAREEFVLLYPGGAREALHRKGEEYKLFWPDRPEFVRMAAKFGVTIIPFGVVGEDDVAQLVLDYNDLKDLPLVREWIEEMNQDAVRLRADINGEISNQEIYIPGLLPKLPGRFYFLFGKPIETKGMDILKDRRNANLVYLNVKSEIESIISYLRRKREEDSYRSLTQRLLYQATWGFSTQVPSFEP
ncbi:acyltransferase-like protein At1g54570, chloroplastic isoform X2 [Ananas comosus]|uniref:Acyltransferase-like protein At1g54570, chloroplastic isoform X2 n=1 Tax=Ananas comosus TaxID=4615 RepID=A0A6P5HJH8_ANACO|nr:acyltransferase-like protein At1g54570, chloroplastic isoform X2 [Ananas comosus]